MRKVIFLSLLTFVLLTARAQVQTQVTGDSVYIHSNTGTGELILQNSTDTVNGFLFNKGGGRTAFVRGLVKIDDSTYLVGADTLHIRNFGGLLFPGPQYSIIRSNGDGTATADRNMGFYPYSTAAELYFQNPAGSSYSDINLDDVPGNSYIDMETLSGWGMRYYTGAERGDRRTTLALDPDSANTSGILLQDYNSGNAVGIYPSSTIISGSVGDVSTSGLISAPNMYNLILPPTSGIDGQVLGKVSQTGNDVILDWMNGGAGSSGTLQNAFDAAPTAIPQINAHGNYFALDSVSGFGVYTYIDSTANAGINSKRGYKLFYGDDSTYTAVGAFQGSANLLSSNNNYTQQLAVTPTSSTFSGTNVVGNPESKVIFQNTDTLLSAPPYIAVFDADTLKKYPFVTAIGGVLIPGSQGNIIRSNGDGTAIADQNMGFYPGSTNGELYFQNSSGKSYNDINVDDVPGNSYIDIENLSGFGLTYSSSSSILFTPVDEPRTSLQLRPDSGRTSGIQFNDYNTGNTVGIYPSTIAGNNYNLILPSDSGTVGKVLSKVSQDGNNVALGWGDAGPASTGTLQNAFDAAPAANPQINAHGNYFVVDSAKGFFVNTYIDSLAEGGISSKGGYSFYYDDDTSNTSVSASQGNVNLSSNTYNSSQQLAVTPTTTTFSGSNVLGNPESKVIFQNTDTLLSAPPYIAAFDGDTLKKLAYSVVGGSETLQQAFDKDSLGNPNITTRKNPMEIYAGTFPANTLQTDFYMQREDGIDMFSASGNNTSEVEVDSFSISLNSAKSGGAINSLSLDTGYLKYRKVMYGIYDSSYIFPSTFPTADNEAMLFHDNADGTFSGYWGSGSSGSSETLQQVINNSSELNMQNNSINIGGMSGTGKDKSPGYYFQITDSGEDAVDGKAAQLFLQPGVSYFMGDKNNFYNLPLVNLDANGLVLDDHGTGILLPSLDSSTDIPTNSLGIGLDGKIHKYAVNRAGPQTLQSVTDNGYVTSNNIRLKNDAGSYLGVGNTFLDTDLGMLTYSAGDSSGHLLLSNYRTSATGHSDLNVTKLTNRREHYLPDGSGTLALSINGIFADSTGNVTIPAGDSGTVTSIGTGFGLTGGTITTSGTVAVDSAALHLKFLGIADSTIYYPFKSNPKNYLTSTNAWGTTGNFGTTGGTNFIGTTDNVPINFRVNNALVGTIGTSSNYNVSFGALSLPNTSTGIKNGAIGGGALGKNTTGFNNFAIGYTTLYNNLTGSNNTANGWAVMGYDSAAVGNTAMGAGAMNQSTSTLHIGGAYNSAFGFDALLDNFNNKYNIGLGYLAGNASSSSNTLYIADSTYHMKYKLDSSSGSAPSVIGKDANGFWHVYQAPAAGGGGGTLTNVATGYGLTGGPITTTGTITVDSATLHSKFVEFSDTAKVQGKLATYNDVKNLWSLNGNTGTTSSNFIGTTDGQFIRFKMNNTVAGIITDYASTGNTSLGQVTGQGGNHNTFFGAGSGYTNSGTYNIGIGWSSLPGGNGSGNIALGSNNLGNMGSGGNNNTALGNSAGGMNYTGSNNIYLGAYAGQYTTGYTSTSGYFYVTDSVSHYYFKNLDSAASTAYNVIGKDGSGYWHVYESPSYGTATLVGGTVTVSTALVKTGARIFVSVNTPGGTQGFLSAPAGNIVNGTSFKINSTSATETSTINWQIIN